MLLTNKLNTKIVPLNIKHLKNFYPNIKLYDIIEIDINHLSKKSPIVIECMCEICGINNKIQYRAYLRNKKRYNYYSCKKCKNKKTDITKKILYGDSKYNNPYKMIQTKEERGIYIPISSVDNFKKYRFHKNIPPYIIGGIENLCITKRKINLLKSNKENFIF
jgi:hypothetical protein